LRILSRSHWRLSASRTLAIMIIMGNLANPAWSRVTRP
jgi:hypothetical protein